MASSTTGMSICKLNIHRYVIHNGISVVLCHTLQLESQAVGNVIWVERGPPFCASVKNKMNCHTNTSGVLL